jgi:glycerol-1-phosphate dehydrogenase [NAD(P)+]
MTLLNGIAAIIIGSTHAGSMGEHLISHYIDMFMGDKHPGSLHGEQVGVATLLLSRMQNDILNNSQPPQFSEINHDLTIFENIFGKDAGTNLHKQFQNKLFTQKSLTEINKKLLENWGSYKKSLITFAVQTDKIKKSFINCGAACTNSDLNIPNDFYQTAIENAYYLRDRFSYLDIMQYLGRIDKYSKNLI